MKHTLAAIFDGVAGQMHLREIPLPNLQPTEVLVRVLGCTLCGSDLHSYAGHRKVPVPTVLGHEIVGEIVEFGADAPRIDLTRKELRLGDRVTWAIVASCGQCFYCNRGLPQKCLESVKYGHEPLRPGRELLGGLAEHCLLVEGTAIIRLPDELPLEVACPASCATATVAAALDALGDIGLDNVVVLGAGLLGLTACAMCSARGAAQIICVDVNECRRERSRQFGATHAIPPAELKGLASHISEGHGVDVVLEFSGATAALETAWPTLRIGGRVVLVGSVFPGAPLSLHLEQMIRRQLTISGVHNYAPRHLMAAIEFLSLNHGRFPFADLVASWLPLRDVARAFELARETQLIRIGVR